MTVGYECSGSRAEYLTQSSFNIKPELLTIVTREDAAASSSINLGGNRGNLILEFEMNLKSNT